MATLPWSVWLDWSEHLPTDRRVVGLIPGLGTYLGCRFDTLGLGTCRGCWLIDISLSLSLCLCVCVCVSQSSGKCPWVRIKTIMAILM